jgi:hypothetical protein
MGGTAAVARQLFLAQPSLKKRAGIHAGCGVRLIVHKIAPCSDCGPWKKWLKPISKISAAEAFQPGRPESRRAGARDESTATMDLGNIMRPASELVNPAPLSSHCAKT